MRGVLGWYALPLLGCDGGSQCSLRGSWWPVVGGLWLGTAFTLFRLGQVKKGLLCSLPAPCTTLLCCC